MIVAQEGSSVSSHVQTKALLLSLALLATPAADARGDLKKGKRLYQAMNCALCHTNGGNNQNPDKPLKGAHFQARYPDDKLLGDAIRKGFPEKGMPAYGKDQISDEELQNIVAYVRSLTPKGSKE